MRIVGLQSARANVIQTDVANALSVPRCYVAQAGAQSMLNGADIVSWSLAARDTDGMFNAALPTRVTCRTGGIFDVKWNLVWAASVGGTHRQAWVRVNGGAGRFGNDLRVPNAVFNRIQGADSITLNAGDYMELISEQDSGGALALAPSAGLYNGAELNVTFLSTF